MKNRNTSKADYNWTGKHILLIEPNNNSSLLWNIYLQATGVRISYFNTPKEAHQYMLKDSPADLMLLELFANPKDGIDLIRLANKKHPKTRILVQTVLAFENIRRTCYKAGCDGFEAKPLKMDELMVVMNDWMRELG